MATPTESQIRQLLARSSDCVWRKDAEHYSEHWAEDGEWRLLGQRFSGRQAIKAAWSQFMAPLVGAWQIANNVALDFGGQFAYGRIYLDETLYQLDGAVTLTRGVYHDVYKIEAGTCVFHRRTIDFLYLGPLDGSRPPFKLPEYGPGARDPNPDRDATPSMQEAYGA